MKQIDEYESNFDKKNIANIYATQKYKNEYILKRLIGKNHKLSIIDIGCGFGSFLYHAGKNGYKNVKGIDQSKKQIEIAKSNDLHNVENIALELWLNKDSQKYDVIILMDLIEHIDPNEVLSIMIRLKEKLNNHGKIIIHTPNASSPLFGHIRYGDITHKNAFTEKSLEQLAHYMQMTLTVFDDPPILNNLKGVLRRAIYHIFRVIIQLYQYSETGRCYKTSTNLYAVFKHESNKIS